MTCWGKAMEGRSGRLGLEERCRGRGKQEGEDVKGGRGRGGKEKLVSAEWWRDVGRMEANVNVEALSIHMRLFQRDCLGSSVNILKTRLSFLL